MIIHLYRPSLYPVFYPSKLIQPIFYSRISAFQSSNSLYHLIHHPTAQTLSLSSIFNFLSFTVIVHSPSSPNPSFTLIFLSPDDPRVNTPHSQRLEVSMWRFLRCTSFPGPMMPPTMEKKPICSASQSDHEFLA